MAWQTPKTNWQAADVVSKDDFNRIEGNAQHLEDTKADKTEFNLHVNNKNNPHNVTASQVGAATPAQLAAKVDKPSSATSGNIAVFDGGAGKLKDSGKSISDFMNSEKKRGYAEYTDAINAGATITKTIALGGTYKHGIVAVHATKSPFHGLLAFVSTTPNNTLVVTAYYDNSPRTIVAYRADERNALTDLYFGRAIADGGNPPDIFITSMYISGTNLIITFRNTATSTKNLACRVNWEVW